MVFSSLESLGAQPVQSASIPPSRLQDCGTRNKKRFKVIEGAIIAAWLTSVHLASQSLPAVEIRDYCWTRWAAGGAYTIGTRGLPSDCPSTEQTTTPISSMTTNE